MPSEWKAVCKDCGDAFTYSDFVHRQRLRRGLSAPERCVKHRQLHAQETRAMASSHFGLEPLAKPSLLGKPFLGGFDRSDRGRPELKEFVADGSGLDLGLKDEQVAEIYRALERNKVLVVVAPTGAGKSTVIPYRLLTPLESSGLPDDHFTRHNRRIVVTQPRRDAASDIPATIARKLHGSSVGAGSEIGYRHSQDRDQTDPWNRLIFLTDGTLANWLIDQRADEFSIIIVDEAHERSTTIDLILGLLRTELIRHPHLKLVILSATIHADSFVRFFEEALPGRVWFRDFEECQKSYGYEVKWPTGGSAVAPARMVDAVAAKVAELLGTTDGGGILAFLPGKEEIGAAIAAIERLLPADQRRRTLVVPLYAALSGADRARATEQVKPRGKDGTVPRRVVIATNLAETSLTIPDVAYVVDSGLIKQSVWDLASRTESLPMRWHSQAGCRQRWGRAGRNRPGTVYPLYTRQQFESFDPYTAPAAVRERLDDIFVQAKRAGQGSLIDFPWLDAPPTAELQRLQSLAADRQYVDAEGDLTQRGSEVFDLYQRIGRFLGDDHGAAARGLDMASLLLLADRHGCLIEAATFVVLLERLGERLYHSDLGLLRFSATWPVEEIDRVGRVQASLRAGCRDDLDFALKLAALYEGIEAGGMKLGGAGWASDARLNVDAMEQALGERDEILRAFNRDVKERGVRRLHLAHFERLRLIASVAWPDLAVDLIPGGRWRAGEATGPVSAHSLLFSRGAGGRAAVAAYGRREPSDDGSYATAPVAGVLVLFDPSKAGLDDWALAGEVRALRMAAGDPAGGLFEDVLQPVGTALGDGRKILVWGNDEAGKPASVAALARPPLDSAAVADNEEVEVRLERVVRLPRTGESLAFVGLVGDSSIIVDAGDLGMAGTWGPALRGVEAVRLRVVGRSGQCPRLSWLPRLEADWLQVLEAAETSATVVEVQVRPTGATLVRLIIGIEGVAGAHHLALCALPRNREYLAGLKEGDRIWLRLRPSEQQEWAWKPSCDEESEAAKAEASGEIEALGEAGIRFEDGELRISHRLCVRTFYHVLAAAPHFERPLRNLFRRCHELWGVPESIETEVSLRCARALWTEARRMWERGWTSATAEVREAVKDFRPRLGKAAISPGQSRALRGVMDDLWKVAELRGDIEFKSHQAQSKRDWITRRRGHSEERIGRMRANIAKNEADIRGAWSAAFVAKASAWVTEGKQKLAIALQQRSVEEAEWSAASREAEALESAVRAAKAKLNEMKQRTWPV